MGMFDGFLSDVKVTAQAEKPVAVKQVAKSTKVSDKSFAEKMGISNDLKVQKVSTTTISKKSDKAKVTKSAKVVSIDSVKSSKKETKKTTTKSKKVAEKKVYANAYDKFADQFSEYQTKQAEEKRKGFAMFHGIILTYIKERSESSKEFNDLLMNDWKDSRNLVKYIENKTYENPEIMLDPQPIPKMYGWIEEYVRLDDKPKPKDEAKKEDKKVTEETEDEEE